MERQSMTYYENIIDKDKFRYKGVYKAHEIEKVEVMNENSPYFKSPWLQITTKEGRHFFLEKNYFDFMQDHPERFPLEDKKGGKKEAVPA